MLRRRGESEGVSFVVSQGGEYDFVFRDSDDVVSLAIDIEGGTDTHVAPVFDRPGSKLVTEIGGITFDAFPGPFLVIRDDGEIAADVELDDDVRRAGGRALHFLKLEGGIFLADFKR